MAEGETQEARIKRMKMRSMRRGIKEMDVILSAFADAHLDTMSEADLVCYDAMLAENDHDLYAWVSDQNPAPQEFARLIERISSNFRSN